MKINLHIERLILDGLSVARHEAHLVQAAVETELARLIATGGLISARGGAMPRLASPDIRLTSNSPYKLGEQIANSVHRGITHGGNAR